MPKFEKLINDLDATSAQISTQTRTVCLGILVFIWGLFLTDIQILTESVINHLFLLLVLTSLAILGLISDFSQYLAGYFNNLILLDKMETEKLTSIKYNKNHILYKLRIWFFYFKIIFTFISTLLLFVFLGLVTFS